MRILCLYYVSMHSGMVSGRNGGIDHECTFECDAGQGERADESVAVADGADGTGFVGTRARAVRGGQDG